MAGLGWLFGWLGLHGPRLRRHLLAHLVSIPVAVPVAWSSGPWQTSLLELVLLGLVLHAALAAGEAARGRMPAIRPEPRQGPADGHP